MLGADAGLCGVAFPVFSSQIDMRLKGVDIHLSSTAYPQSARVLSAGQEWEPFRSAQQGRQPKVTLNL